MEPRANEIEEHTMDYTTLLNHIGKSLGQDSYGELRYYLCELRCPDGSYLIDSSMFQDKNTPENLLIYLLHTNQCSWRDVDFLVHIIKAMNRRDLLPLVQDFVKRIGIGQQSVSKIHCWKHFCLLKVHLNPALHRIDLSVVSVIKHSLCIWFDLAEVPYNVSFLGWTANPIIMHFQLPLATVHSIEQGLKSSEKHFLKVGVKKMELIVNKVSCVYGT